jgi:LacI family transcriptional regulator
MTKHITIRDIAKMAKVSVGTVDRVIHKRGEVAEKSYKKVVAILEKTGYRPNLIARTLVSSKSVRIAVLLPNPKQDEYWQLSVEGIDQAQHEWAQYSLELTRYYFDLYKKDSFKTLAAKVLKSAPDGIIAAPVFTRESVEFFTSCKEHNIPFVLVNSNLTSPSPLSFIGQDLYQSGMLGAELLHQGQKEAGTYAILHIYDDIHASKYLSEKEKGFRDYFKEQGDKNYQVTAIDLNYTHTGTLEQELLELFSNARLRGILVTTSKGAQVVSRMLEKRGKKNVRLVAYDLLKSNIRHLRAGVIDFLINQNSKRQTFIGINQLINHLLFRKKVVPEYLFPLEIVTRKNLQSYLDSVDH